MKLSQVDIRLVLVARNHMLTFFDRWNELSVPQEMWIRSLIPSFQHGNKVITVLQSAADEWRKLQSKQLFNITMARNSTTIITYSSCSTDPFSNRVLEVWLGSSIGLPPPPSVWPHLFCGAGHEKGGGESSWSGPWHVGCTSEVSFFHVQLRTATRTSSYSPVGPSAFYLA